MFRWIKKMIKLSLECNNCNIGITIISNDKSSEYFIANYGLIDKVTGRIFEMECPLCQGVLEKV